MDLQINRNMDSGKYEVIYDQELVLAHFDALSSALDHAKLLGKRFGKNVYIGAACMSDWYTGIREDGTSCVFEHTGLPDSVRHSQYKFIEGPFIDKEKALTAAYSLSGQYAE
jgi:hypothetical protein